MKIISLKLDNDLLDAFDRMVEHLGNTRSDALRSLMRVAVTKHQRSRAQDADEVLRQMADAI